MEVVQDLVEVGRKLSPISSRVREDSTAYEIFRHLSQGVEERAVCIVRSLAHVQSHSHCSQRHSRLE